MHLGESQALARLSYQVTAQPVQLIRSMASPPTGYHEPLGPSEMLVWPRAGQLIP